MAVVQQNYSERMAAAVPGMVVNENPHSIDTRVVESSSGLPFGRACSQGSADMGVAGPGGTLANFVGISVRDVTLDPVAADSDYVDEYQQYDNAGILTMGDIWVTAGAAVSKNDPVHFNATTGALTNTGGSGPIVGARWMTSAASGALGVVRLSGALP